MSPHSRNHLPVKTVFGVDGCRGGWFYIRLDDSEATFGHTGELGELVQAAPSGAPLFVDIPIGLRDADSQWRLCDRQARELLGRHRQASVFKPPVRAVLAENDYQSANESSKRLTGQGLSKQSYSIAPKIREVDDLLYSCPRARSMVREAHPEVCFYGLAGGRPMRNSKKSEEGFRERLDVLRLFHSKVEETVDEALDQYPRKTLQRDDILDAFACAITASMPQCWQTAPQSPETDSSGLPMEMVYIA